MTSTYDTLVSTLQEVVRAVANCARSAVRAISAQSLPGLAVACVLIALAMTLVPLALGLFILFVAVKLIAGSVSERDDRGVATPYKPVDPVDLSKPRHDGDIKGE